ncbi:MAG: GNAT family N-acetyltransferase [Myxococcales bacterium]|nr:GNAT family N-acetyltransferase [Myxococcales bacterium]MCB9583126.1 GNAT family N-acetyltransferase [Polyangiaceae bacterium]
MIRARLLEATSPRVEAIWRTLEQKARPSFFGTWGFVECWLACLPAAVRPRLWLLERDGAPAAACFLGRRKMLRRGAIVTRALFLNATGVPRFDDLCLEHNEVLGAAEAGITLNELLAQLPPDHDELFLPALAPERMPGSRLCERLEGRHVRVDRQVPAPFVDLDRVRSSGSLGWLGASTRGQVRRAEKLLGPITAEVAADEAAALDVFEELVGLHTARWTTRGEDGAFADPWVRSFHRRLIRSRLRHGEIQLLRVRAADATVGCLYGLVANGRVLFYQGGLAQFADPRVKPGYLCHVKAIEHAAREGHARYDLLAGGADYKRRLADSEVVLRWARVQRDLARFAVEDAARALWRATRRR